MKRRLVSFVWLSLAVPPVSAQGYQKVFDELRTTAPRTDRVATVRQLTLRRDVAEFRLADGKLYELTAVAGRTVGAVFIGTGSVSFAPPLAIERHQLQRVLGDSVLTTDITSAVFLFTDSTPTELERQLTFGAGPAERGAAGVVETALNRLLDQRTRQADPTLMTELLNGDANGYFFGYIKQRHGEDLIVVVDPYQPEEIQLLRLGHQIGQKIQVVSQFPRAEHLGDTLTVDDSGPDPLRLGAYRLEVTIGNDLGFAATTTVQLTARRERIRWARFLLFDELTVDSVVDQTGARDSFFRAPDSPELWIRFDTTLTPGQPHSLRIVYHGHLIDHGSAVERLLAPGDVRRIQLGAVIGDQWFFIKSTSLWFPRYGSWQACDMDLTFHTPKRYQFSSIGRLVETRVDGDVRTTRWTTERPTGFASFNIGDFKEFKITDPRIPPVTVHVNAEAHRHLDQVVMQVRDPEQYVGADVANSLGFFTRVFGPPLFSQYYATEIPYGHGEAFPGLIHLSWFTFGSLDRTGEDQIFRAHEMAHQWWGIGVAPATYRDAWLSEGFSDFAGLWYMQQILKDNDKFFKQLQTSRDAIRARRRDAPPIGLGLRTGEQEAEDYQLMVYRKGAWVLQMLRNLMLDLRTMNEDAFSATMQDFYRTYRGRRASTRDFQKIIEQHVGGPMGWFFDEWVYGTAIPTYVMSWTAEPADDHYRLRLRVRQENASKDFAMPVPLLIEFADNTHALVRVNVRGPLTEKELRVPAQPTRLQLNALSSVLAEVREEDWH